jgi:hypothetical protein
VGEGPGVFHGVASEEFDASLFQSLISLANVLPGEGLVDAWSHWCPPQPKVELHKQV